jgi:hypothetical protein
MFGLDDIDDSILNIVFLLITGYIAVNGIRYRDEDGNPDFVRQIYACIAAAFFLMVFTQDILGVASF